MADERSTTEELIEQSPRPVAGIQRRFVLRVFRRKCVERRRGRARVPCPDQELPECERLLRRGDEVRLLDDALIGVRIERPNRNDNVMNVCVPLSPHSESGSCSNFVHQTRESGGVSMSSPETQTLRGSACSR